MNTAVKTLPETVEEFRKMLDMSTPENTCTALICALRLYTKDAEAGCEAVDMLRGPRPMNNYDRQFLRDRLRDKKYLPLAYFTGASPENGYKPSQPYTLEFLPDPNPQNTEEGYIKIFVKTKGASSPRPVTLRRKGDMWCAWEYSSILTGVKTPAEEDPWA